VKIPMQSDPLNENAMTGQRHPDHEFLYVVRITDDGEPVYTSRFFVPKSTVGIQGKGSAQGLLDRTGIPSRMLGT
jgi:hypothetical protein